MYDVKDLLMMCFYSFCLGYFWAMWRAKKHTIVVRLNMKQFWAEADKWARDNEEEKL